MTHLRLMQDMLLAASQVVPHQPGVGGDKQPVRRHGHLLFLWRAAWVAQLTACLMVSSMMLGSAGLQVDRLPADGHQREDDEAHQQGEGYQPALAGSQVAWLGRVPAPGGDGGGHDATTGVAGH